MLRYYALATVIVVVFGSILCAHRIASGKWDLRAEPTGTPTITQGNGESGSVSGAFVGDGPWVLSALPDCFEQESSIAGSVVALSFDRPPERARLAAGTRLQRGPCSIEVRARDLVISRGRDRLRVPPLARLYRMPDGLVLVYEARGRAQIRRYRDVQIPGSHK